MNDDYDEDNVLVFRNQADQPVVVPHDIALENDKVYQAYMDHIGGMSWALVASKHGYLDGTAARATVSRYADEAKALITESGRRHLLVSEISRLDALQTSIWKQAMGGHLPAVNTVINLIMCRVKILGLDQGAPEEEKSGAITVINADGYQTELQRAIDHG